MNKGTFMDFEFRMPQKANFESQEQGCLACGLFVLSWMEQELRFQRGEWLRTWIQFSVKHWRESLQKVLGSLKKEPDFRNKELHLMTDKIEKMTLEAVKRATEAEKKLEAQQSKRSAAAQAAQAAITKYTGRFAWQQLSQNSKAKVIALKGSVRVL